MDLTMEGRKVLPQPGQSLLELVKQLGLDVSTLTERPLAAKIAGEVFTLNYIPVRQKEAEADRQSMRRAMAASNGEIRLLRYADPAGKECYIRTAQFTIFLAMRQLWPEATAKMTCTLGSSVYISVAGAKDFSASTLKARVSELVGQDIPLIRRRVKLQKAIDRFREEGQTDKARLLSWRTVDYFDEYAYGDFADYYYGEMMPSTGYLTVWDILPADGGFVFVYPDDGNPEICAKVPPMPNFFSVFNEGERWGELMECQTVADLNDLTNSGRIRELIRENLQYSGYTCEEAGDGSAALSLLSGGGYDLVILDLMMPFMDGMTCLREMRNRHINTPVIILTARGEEYDKLAGLEGGADDYVVKPFSPRELVARVRAVLNRTMPRAETSSATMTFGDLTIDTASHTVRVAGEDVALTPKEFDLLVFLASNKGIALSREKILQKVWNYDYFGEDRTVDTHVKMLRGHLGKCRSYIATVWGIGYKFDPDAVR